MAPYGTGSIDDQRVAPLSASVSGSISTGPPVGFTFLRYFLAAVTLLALLRWREGAIRLPRGDVLPIALLGVIGIRFNGQTLEWDSQAMRFTNNDEANKYVAPPFRKGWSL